jgi:hypothetical protein
VSGKVDLLIECRPDGHHNDALGPRPFALKRTLPLFQSDRGTYVHRVRSAAAHPSGGRAAWYVNHISVTYWGGNGGFLRGPQNTRNGGRLLADLPTDGSPVCATCEGRAVGAGFPSLALIVRHSVKFAPRGAAA